MSANPALKPADYHYQVSGYALGLNQRHADSNPVKYVAVTNGLIFLLYPPIVNITTSL